MNTLTPTSDTPLVSVVTVCFNLVKNGRADFFRDCAQSVHNQTYSNIEHLIIDGGSTDGTVELLKEYEQKGWIRYISEPDKGIYDAMNKGIRAAKGKYVAFLNSDDYWHADTGVADSVNALETTGADFSYASRNVVHENGELKHIEQAAIGVFAILMPFCHQTMFTRRDTLLQHGGFDDKTFKSAGDYDLILRMLLSGATCAYVPRNFTSFRMSGLSSGEEGCIASLQEMSLCHRRLLGEEAAAMLSRGYMDTDLFLHICGRVSPVVAQDMLRCYAAYEPGIYRLASGQLNISPSGRLSVYNILKERVTFKLLGFIPLLTRRDRANRTDWNLFGFLPLLRKTRGKKGVCYRLFCSIPLLSITSPYQR